MKKRIYYVLMAVLPLFWVACSSNDSPDSPPGPQTPEIPENTIPVVFHILYENPGNVGQNIPANVIQRRIEQLNAFFLGMQLPGLGANTPPANDVPINLQFMLATHAPDGTQLQEPGINRVAYPNAGNMSAVNFLSTRTLSTQDRAMNWDQNRYVNIWVFNFLQSTNSEVDETFMSGISHLPYALVSNPLPGLVASNYYVANMPAYMHGMALNNRWFTETEGTYTFVHEMCHYLGLKHVFIEEEDGFCGPGDDSSDDHCADTPRYSRLEYMLSFSSMPEGARMLRVSCSGDVFPSTNVMDYFEGLRHKITPNQRQRIEHVYANSPLIPRSTRATRAWLEDFTGEISDEIPVPILMK